MGTERSAISGGGGVIRSRFAITRLIILPFGALLLLYLLVVGGGGGWLYLQVREAESQLLVDELLAQLEPLAKRLASADAVALMGEGDSWLNARVQGLFAGLPSLRGVSVRGREGGFEMRSAPDGMITTMRAPPLPPDVQRLGDGVPVVQRLHGESAPRFFIRFDLTPADAPLVRLDFRFDRPAMLAQINAGVASIEQATLWFALAGGVSILLAVALALAAMHATRRIEAQFQEIYRRASITEMAAELVHDLRNPLMAMRANIKALLVSPEQINEIVEELDQDIVTLSDQLSGFLKLTRSHDDAFAPVAVEKVIRDAARLAEPVLAQHGLELALDIAPALPAPRMQEAAIRDALLNLIINACQSGQREGAVRVIARATDEVVTLAVEDRGDGIEDQHLPHLFNPFYTTKADGNGLGLAIVQRIVEAHHGVVCAENLPQGGARVFFTLPLGA